MQQARTRSIAWLAIVLVALNALGPRVAHARPTVPGLLVPLCTIDGITHYSELPAPKPPLEQRSDANHEHCKICVFGIERAFVSTVPLPVINPAGREIAPPLAAAELADRLLDSSARPRAPPYSA